MWTTFVITLKALVRQRTLLFWALAFPLVLATLFHALFAGVEESYGLQSVPVAVVQDAQWADVAGADALVTALSDVGSAGGDSALVKPRVVDSVEEAEALLRAGEADAYVHAVDGQGAGAALALAVADTKAADTSGSDGSRVVSLSALRGALDHFNESGQVHAAIARDFPSALADPVVAASLGASQEQDYALEISLTHVEVSGTARYYFALLGMACLLAATPAIYSVTLAQPNLSALGARRSVSPLPKWRGVTAGFLASWLISFACLTTAFLYIRHVCGVEIGGRDGAAILGVAAATLMTSSLGTAIGALPRLAFGVKVGIGTGLSTGLAVFAGLYGQPAMDLADAIHRSAPALHLVNPAMQTATVFYDLLYYDSLAPFWRTVAVLTAMAAVFLAVALVLVRRQRYEHL